MGLRQSYTDSGAFWTDGLSRQCSYHRGEGAWITMPCRIDEAVLSFSYGIGRRTEVENL